MCKHVGGQGGRAWHGCSAHDTRLRGGERAQRAADPNPNLNPNPNPNPDPNPKPNPDPDPKPKPKPKPSLRGGERVQRAAERGEQHEAEHAQAREREDVRGRGQPRREQHAPG